jgi:MSHA biogenesis protein MshL
MNRLLCIMSLFALTACSSTTKSHNTTAEAINSEMDAVVKERAEVKKSNAVNNALLPPLNASLPEVDSKPLESRFDLSVNNTPASQVLSALVSGTRYSIVVPPDMFRSLKLWKLFVMYMVTITKLRVRAFTCNPFLCRRAFFR